jgi:hypothetical protein
MDKKIIVGIAAGGALVVGGLTFAAIKVVKTLKTAKQQGVPVTQFLRDKKAVKKAERDSRKAAKKAEREAKKAKKIAANNANKQAA